MKRMPNPASYNVVKALLNTIKSTKKDQTFGRKAIFCRLAASWNLKAINLVVCSKTMLKETNEKRSQELRVIDQISANESQGSMRMAAIEITAVPRLT